MFSYKQSQSLDSFYTGGRTALIPPLNIHLASTCNEDIAIVHVATGRVKARLEGKADAVTCFAVSQDGQLVVSAARSLLLKTWDISNLTTSDTDSHSTESPNALELRSWKGHEAPVLAMDFDATSTLVASGSADSTVRVWDARAGYATHAFKGHRGLVTSIAFSPDKKEWWTLFSGAEDGQIRVWDLKSKNCKAILESHVSVVRGLVPLPDGKLLSGGRDKVAILWDLKTGSALRTIPHSEPIEALGVVPHAELPSNLRATIPANELSYYTAHPSGSLHIHSLYRHNLITATNPTSGIFEVHYHPEEGLIAVTNDQHFLFYSLPKLDLAKTWVGTNDEIIDLALLSPGKVALCANSEQPRVYDLETGACELLFGHTEVAICLAATSSVLITGSKDRTAIVWTPSVEGKWVARGTLKGHTEAIGAVALPAHGNWVATGSSDRTIKVWNVTIPKEGDAKVDSRWTVLAHEKDINSLAVAPNGKLLASGSQDKTAKLWDPETGNCVGELKGHKRGVWSVAFSPVDRVLVTGSGDKMVKIWSLADMSCLRTLEGHLNSVLRVAFLGAGQVVSAGGDGLVKIWKVKESECVGTLDGGEGKVWALAVSGDGEKMASGGGDSVLRIWDDVTAQEAEERRVAEEERIAKEQDLANLVRRKEYAGAVRVAMELGQPFKLAKLFKEVMDEHEEGSVIGKLEVDAVLRGLETGELEKLLGYVRDWNTNGRWARVAQGVLHALLRFFPAREISALPKCKELVDALVPYTERHLKQLDDLITRSYLVEFTLESMDLLLGPLASADADEVEVDALWKNRGDRSSAAQQQERRLDGDALDDDFEPEVRIEEGELGWDDEGDWVGGNDGMEVDGASDGGMESEEETRPNGRMVNGVSDSEGDEDSDAESEEEESDD